MDKSAVLLISPSFKLNGGVVEFNKMLLNYSKSNIRLFELKSGLSKSFFIKSVLMFFDYLRFILILLFRPISIVHINPSLGKNAVQRDGNFIRISKWFNKKVYVHWHGWNPENEYLLEGNNLKFLKRTFFDADHIKFLSNKFAEKFRYLGFMNKISIGNTFIDDKLLNQASNKPKSNTIIKILFLSTISRNKGIYIALSAFKEVLMKFKNVEFVVAGDGIELDNAKQYTKLKGIHNVRFLGHITGEQKREIYSECHIYILPSYYEGMPTSLLEAMGFGLVLICSNAGAIPDFFTQDKMGKMISTFEVEEFASSIIYYLENIDRIESVKEYNISFSRKNFMASESVDSIDSDYKALLI